MDKAAFNFNKWNTIGWLTFGIALLTYTLTVEPTMSFGIVEYIATAAKLSSLRSALIPDDWRFFAMFASDNTKLP
jgi:hypothetical protein